MNRISREMMFMEMARSAAKRSTCFRLNVGAIIAYKNTPVSIGYNGVPSGEPHCVGENCPGRLECKLTDHAEANAIRRMARLPKPHSDELRMYCTDSPCEDCMMRIRAAGIKILFFEKLYRVNNHLDRFANEVQMFRVTPAGFIVNHFTGSLYETIK